MQVPEVITISQNKPKMSSHLPNRYDWMSLKMEYLKGPWKLVEDFRKAKGFPPVSKSQQFYKKTKGWRGEKDKMMQKALEIATGRLAKHTTDDIEEVRARQARLARWLQLKGTSALQKIEGENIDVDNARKLVVAGLKEERAALGLDGTGKGVSPQLTQVNVNLPKTNIDAMINNMSYEELLEFIAEVKRERTRRAGTADIVESSTEAK